MTGFAIAQGTAGANETFTLMAKSVNHRFLDLQFRLPPQTDALELRIRKLLKEQLCRGHVDVTLTLERSSTKRVRLQTEVLDAYIAAFRQAAHEHGLTAEPELNSMLGLPGVVAVESGGSREITAELDDAVMLQMGPLIDDLKRTREEEGSALAHELRSAMDRVRDAGEEIARLRGEVRETQFARLRARLAELTRDLAVSEERVLTEAAMLAERSDVEEETVRLRTHADRFLVLLDGGGEVGKRLDFLLQELNREANTLLSKTGGHTGDSGLRITDLGLSLKAEIERAREQVQNLE